MLEEEAATCLEINENICEDMISALPDSLLVQILLLLPTKDAVATSILSKPWRYIWTLLPKLVFNDTSKTKSFKLSSRFNIQCSAKPIINIPKRLYTCNMLKELTLTNKTLVKVPSQAFLPSLLKLELLGVVYKDEDSLVRLLSSCNVLQTLNVERTRDDNVMKFSVKVPSLNTLVYINLLNSGGSLIIDSPRLKNFRINDCSNDDCLIECMNPSLVMASVHVTSHPNELFLRSLSSVLFLNMTLIDETEVFCSAINFSQLIECKLRPCGSEYWVESVMLLLHNAPKLKVLMISSEDIEEYRDLPSQIAVPGCKSSPLEIFEWKEYGGTGQEKHLLTYILENSKCLKTAGISIMPCYFDIEKEMIMEELKSISRVSVSSQLLFSVSFKWRSLEEHLVV
ncbi:hypothetical protein N665_0137s0046 [Sinapis alba]|nr:hypothetical protein N665_0137s0046 [Sinapis alba]